MKSNWLSLLFILLFIKTASLAAPVKVTFLDDEVALKETMELLRTNGCQSEVLSSFKRAVTNYNATPTGLNLQKFPRKEAGYYSFASVSNLVEALPGRLCDASHPYEINCYDTVILLTKNFLRISALADAISGPILAPKTTTNNFSTMVISATPRDAYASAYPPWYLSSTHDDMKVIEDNTRICLTSAFYCFRCFPNSTTETNLAQKVFEALKVDWNRQKIEFPKNMEVVLCSGINFPNKFMLTIHAGLLLKHQRHYVFLEKSGGSGPFVRLDFEDKADLNVWLASEFGGLGWTHVFATFNDQEVEAIPIH